MKTIVRSSLVLAAMIGVYPMLNAATNLPPTVNCPIPVVVECTSSNGTPVKLQASVSDPEGDALTIIWAVDGLAYQTNTLAAGSTQTATNEFMALFGVGSHDITVTVADATNTASCSSTVTVRDTTPPTIISVRTTPSTLWPPNHQFVPATVSVVATDACGVVHSRIKSVTSNEPVLGKGDGHTSPDWIITGDLTAKLRSERSGRGDGRWYTFTVECTDDAGNSSMATVAVLVPHDQSGQNQNNSGVTHGQNQRAIRAAAAQRFRH